MGYDHGMSILAGSCQELTNYEKTRLLHTETGFVTGESITSSMNGEIKLLSRRGLGSKFGIQQLALRCASGLQMIDAGFSYQNVYFCFKMQKGEIWSNDQDSILPKMLSTCHRYFICIFEVLDHVKFYKVILNIFEVNFAHFNFYLKWKYENN